MDNRTRKILVFGAVTLLAVAVASVAIEDFWAYVGSVVLVVAMIAAYFLPTIIAGSRKHHNVNAIAVVNVLFGWTLLGWAVALIWALTAVQNPYSVQPQVVYRVGDVVNGHRFNGQTWQPLP